MLSLRVVALEGTTPVGATWDEDEDAAAAAAAEVSATVRTVSAADDEEAAGAALAEAELVTPAERKRSAALTNSFLGLAADREDALRPRLFDRPALGGS